MNAAPHHADSMNRPLPQVVWLHVDHQTDAKSLLGAYTCTAVPGEFAWQPGPLARAVTEGRWVVFENINAAPADVLAALVPLLEGGALHVPSRAEVLEAAPGFQVIGTVTTAPGGGGGGAYASSSMVKELLGGLWAFVAIDAPSDAEQALILAAAYGVLAPLLPAAMATLRLVQLAAGHLQQQQQQQQQQRAWGADEAAADAWGRAAEAALQAAGLKRGELALQLARHFSLRDLFKWCNRMQVGVNSRPTTQQDAWCHQCCALHKGQDALHAM